MVAALHCAACIFGVGIFVFGCVCIENGMNRDGTVFWPLMWPGIYATLTCTFAAGVLSGLAEILAAARAILRRLTPPAP